MLLKVPGLVFVLVLEALGSGFGMERETAREAIVKELERERGGER